jgi:DNA-binding XRE family transcriptional regulator
VEKMVVSRHLSPSYIAYPSIAFPVAMASSSQGFVTQSAILPVQDDRTEIVENKFSQLVEQSQQPLSQQQLQSLIQYLQQESRFRDHIAIAVIQNLLISYQEKEMQGTQTAKSGRLVPSFEVEIDATDRSIQIKTNLNQENLFRQIHKLLEDWFMRHQAWVQTAQEIWSHLTAWALEDLRLGLPADQIQTMHLAALKAKIAEAMGDQQSLSMNNRLHFLENHYAQKIAQTIVHELNLPRYSLADLEQLLGISGSTAKRHTPITEVSLTRLGSVAAIPTGLPIVSSISAQLQTELWQPDDQGVAYFRYSSKNKQNNYLEHYITSPGDIETLPWEAAEQIINKFGFNTVKLQMILAAHAMRQAKPWEGTFTIKATEIIEELGWNKNHSSNLPTKRNEVASIAHALSCLLVKAVWVEGKGKTQVDASTPIGRMWEILIDPHGQFDWTTGRIENPNEIYITVRPGLWTAHFLNQAGSKAKEALYQFGYLALNILKIDPYHDELALRLAIHLTIDVRIRARDRNPYEYKVRSLLNAILPETIIQEACESSDKARNLLKRWNHACNLLGSLGWHCDSPEAVNPNPAGIFYTVPYPEWMEPDSKQKKPRGWIEQWLAQKLVIRPPEPIPERMSRLQRDTPVATKRLKAKNATPLSAEAVKQARVAKGWTQAKLAGTVKVHQSLIAKIESGKRAINDDLATTLRQILDL